MTVVLWLLFLRSLDLLSSIIIKTDTNKLNVDYFYTGSKILKFYLYYAQSNYILLIKSEKTIQIIWRSEDRALLHIVIIKANEMHYFSNLFW